MKCDCCGEEGFTKLKHTAWVLDGCVIHSPICYTCRTCDRCGEPFEVVEGPNHSSHVTCACDREEER